MKPPTILHLDIDAFFAAVEVLLDPALAGKPVIVGGLAHERGVVCTASYEARRFGVHSGMALRTAARKCPQGVFLRGRYHLYARMAQRFFACLRRFSPAVDEVSVDEAYVDLSGSRYLAPSVYTLAERIKRRTEKETGLRISGGLGSSRLGAKLATDAAKPGGLFWLQDEREFIANLAVEKIPGIGPQTALILQGLGISRVHELRQRYPLLWRRFVGFPEARPHEPANRSFSRETTFPDDLADGEMIRSHLAYLTGRLAMHLSEEGLFAGRIEVKVRFSDFSTFCGRAALPFPTFATVHLGQAAFPLLDSLRRKKKLPLRLVGVKVEELSRGRDILPFLSLKEEHLTGGLRRVRERFGFTAVRSGREMLLDSLYPVEREGLVLRTASLTK